MLSDSRGGPCLQLHGSLRLWKLTYRHERHATMVLPGCADAATVLQIWCLQFRSDSPGQPQQAVVCHEQAHSQLITAIAVTAACCFALSAGALCIPMAADQQACAAASCVSSVDAGSDECTIWSPGRVLGLSLPLEYASDLSPKIHIALQAGCMSTRWRLEARPKPSSCSLLLQT